MNRNTPYTSIERFIDHWDGVRMVTLELLQCFVDDDLSYRFADHWRTTGEIFHHIGGHQYFVARGVLLRRWDPEPGEPDVNWGHHKKSISQSINQLYEWLTEVQTRLHEWVKKADDDVLTDIREDNPWHEGMRGWLLLHHPYQDEIHHRGQLYAVARHLGYDPPEIFAEEYPDYWNSRKGH
ncbi:MAG: DinB family protein [Candidatus Odinarchaeota archaeon]